MHMHMHAYAYAACICICICSWRAGMTKLAALPHVSCKLSMLGEQVSSKHE